MSGPLSPQACAAECGVSRETLQRLEAYVALLAKWQARINLVGPATMADPWRRHILDSAQLIPYLASGAILDIGTGAGFPGLVLAILDGDRAVHLVESDQRKCAFLNEAARVTGAKVTIHPARIEAVPAFPVGVVTARACAALDKLLAWAERFAGETTECLFLKGEGVAGELTQARESWKMSSESFPSRSDPRGAILRIKGFSRVRES